MSLSYQRLQSGGVIPTLQAWFEISELAFSHPLINHLDVIFL